MYIQNDLTLKYTVQTLNNPKKIKLSHNKTP